MGDIFYGKIKDFQLRFQSQAEFDSFARENEGYDLIIEIKRRKRTRSHYQNNYLWGGVYPIILQGLKDMGIEELKTKEDVHLMCKLKFLSAEAEIKSGETITILSSTAELTPTEFGEFIEKIARWSAEYLGCVVPPPNTQTDLEI